MKILPAWILLLLVPTLGICCGCASSGTTDDAHLKESYGAIAYAPGTQDWRMRWQAVDARRARERALADCAAADCQVVLEFSPGQCGTLALGSGGFGAGQGDTPIAAETAALNECQRTSSGCRVAAAECNH